MGWNELRCTAEIDCAHLNASGKSRLENGMRHGLALDAMRQSDHSATASRQRGDKWARSAHALYNLARWLLGKGHTGIAQERCNADGMAEAR